MKATSISIDANQLSNLNPFDQLPERVLEYVAKQAELRQLSPETVVHSLGETDDRICYLLQGAVETRNHTGIPHRLTAGSERCLSPLTAQQPAEISVRTIGKANLLFIRRELYDAIRQLSPAKPRNNQQRPETDAAPKGEDEIYWGFQEMLGDNKLELPSMPDIAMRIAKVINDPDTDSAHIAKVVQADPTVAARLISVVNSAAYRGQSSIKSLPEAVTRLGRNVIHNLVISFALGSLFRSRSKPLYQRMLELWKHACHVAAICHELGKVTPGMSPDHALLCGLVHDIGALPIISAARSHPELSEQPETLDHIIQRFKPEVGAMVLREWDFDDDFIRVALHSEDWMYDGGDEPSYLDLVLVAKLHAYIGTPRMQQLPRLDLIPAFHKLALGRLTPRHSIGILENAKEQIRELQTLLSGS